MSWLRSAGVELPSNTPEGLLELVFKDKYNDLPEYLAGFAYTCAVMSDAEALERVAYELAQDNLEEGVRYIEVRFAPQLHSREGFDITQVLQAVDRGLKKAQLEFNRSPAVTDRGEPPFHYGIIASAMRMFTPGFSPYFEDLFRVLPSSPKRAVYSVASTSLARSVVAARDEHGLPVVGFDLAGAEAGNPASSHIDAYRYAHRNFLKKTVHAGEAYGPESIFQAITTLYADRIGHGTHLFSVDRCDAADPEQYVKRLSEYIADRRITLEVCITSNMQTMPELTKVAEHPFGRMIKERLSVTLCTDNRLVSRTTVTDEILKACDAFWLSRRQLHDMIVYGFKRSFFPGSYRQKRAYVRQIIDYCDEVFERFPADGD